MNNVAKEKEQKIKIQHNPKDFGYEEPLAQYLSEIDAVRLLTREEEEFLARKSFEGDEEAKGKLIKANLRFVVNIAKKYQKRGLPLIDLINEGNMGLITAASKFDYRKGYHFISYAVWWIKQSILKALSEKTKLIRLPLNRANQLIQIEKLKKENEQFRKSDLTNQEIASFLQIEENSVSNILNASRDYVSLDAPILFDKKERHLADILKDETFRKPDEQLVVDSLRETLHRSIETLNIKERKVICLRYGLDGEEPMSLKEIGGKFKLTKERIRQIEKKAIRRLQHPSRSQTLRAFLHA